MSRVAYDVDGLGAPQTEVASRLRAVRQFHGLSLRDFASRLTEAGHRVSHTAVAKYEDGELKITPDYLDLVGKAFGVSYGWFLSGLGSDDLLPGNASLDAAGLDFLPRYLHTSVSARLDALADWCGVPDGAIREGFFQELGDFVRTPFSRPSIYFRPWEEFSEREISVYVATAFATLRTLLRRSGEGEPPPGTGSAERFLQERLDPDPVF